MIETFRACIEDGDFERMRDFYDTSSRLVAHLPSGTFTRVGAESILDQLVQWWPSPGELVHWSVTSYEAGHELVLERQSVGEGPSRATRQWQEIRLDRGVVDRQQVWSDKPRHGRVPPLPEGLAGVVGGAQRMPLTESGFSGSLLERLELPDGTRYVLKHVAPRNDLLPRLTNDRGREALLFTSGVLERVGEAVDYPVVAVVPEPDGWAILLRDVSESLLVRDGDTVADWVDAGVRATVLRSVGRLHELFRGEQVGEACTVTDRLRFLGPVVTARESGAAEALPRWVHDSWDVFLDLVPVDVADAVSAIHADPADLAKALEAGGTTLIHGDLWAPNIGVTAERVQLLDWALACQAPAEMEYAFWVLWNAASMDVPPQTLLDEVRAVAELHIDERLMRLALLGEFVSGAGARGWAWSVVNHPDPATRQSEKQELDWWVERVRDVLEHVWAP